MQVLDASAVVDLLLRNRRGRQVAQHLEDDLVAPELLDVEVTSAMARLTRGGLISESEARQALGALVRLPARRISTTPLVPRVWELRQALRVADAFYVACATALAAPLLTTDARLGSASIPGLTVIVVR